MDTGPCQNVNSSPAKKIIQAPTPPRSKRSLNCLLKYENEDRQFIPSMGGQFRSNQVKSGQIRSGQIRSGQVWGHKYEQRVAASTLRQYSCGLRLAIAQADASPTMFISLRQASVWPSPRKSPDC